MRKEKIDEIKLEEMKNRLDCTFCDDGEFSEMILDLDDYKEKTSPMADIEFGFFEGDVKDIKAAVALVDEDWVQYYHEGTSAFCGFEGGKIVSFCIVEKEPYCILSPGGKKIGGIGCVGTVPQYRKRGIGLRMVDLATVYLKEEGYDRANISYTPIEKWYGKLGYQTFTRFSLNNK